MIAHACSDVSDFAIPSTSAHHTSPSMELSRQEYWTGLPFLLPGELPNPGIKLTSPALAGKFFTTEFPGKPITMITIVVINSSQYVYNLYLHISYVYLLITV